MTIQPWCTPFPIWNQSVVPRLVLTVASWPAYRFLRRQVRWFGIPVSLRIFHILWSTQRGDWSHSYRTVLPCLCLHLANYLVSFFTPNWSTHLPKDVCATFFSDASLHRGLWVHVHTYYGVGSLPCSTPKKTSWTCADREVFLDLRVGHLFSLL